MPSVNSSSMPKVFDSSTVTVPSLPTLSMASASTSPMAGSAAEIDATWAISVLPSISFDCSAIDATAAATAFSMPRLEAIGLAPAATLRRPSRMSAWARTVAVVVPSPATSLVLVATSLTSWAPMFSNGSSSSTSLAIVTPSLVIVGAPNFLSITTLRPFGPRVTFTVSASLLTPASRPRRAASSNFRIFGIGDAIPLSMSRPLGHCRGTKGVADGRASPAPPAPGDYLSSLARTSRPERISRSSPSTVISVPPYFE